MANRHSPVCLSTGKLKCSNQRLVDMGRSHLSLRTEERFTAIKTSGVAAMDRSTSTTWVCHRPLTRCPRHFTGPFPEETYTNSAMNPVQFCLQPDNTFVVRNLGNRKNDPSDDANIVQMCSPINTLGPYTIELHTAATSNSPYCTTIGLQIAPDPPVFPTGCPSSTIPIPAGDFRIRSFAQKTLAGEVWLLVNIDVQGTVVTTSDVNEATRFSPTGDGTGRIQTSRDGYSYYSAFAPYFNEDSGYIRMYPDGVVTPAVTFCLQSDNSLVVYSAGEDGPTPADPRFVLTCPNRAQPVYLDNGSYGASRDSRRA